MPLGPIAPTLLAYFAGFFDGEGSAMLINRRHRAKTRSWVIRVSVSNTVREPLDLLAVTFGGSVSLAKNKNPTHRDNWMWRTESAKARAFLHAVYPYLRIKRPQADVIFAYEDTLSISLGRRGHAAGVEDLRNGLRDNIRALNAKGRTACR
jgi:hypothetical protein